MKRASWPDILMIIGIGVFLALLPFHLVIKKLVPEPAGTYWKEALLVILVLVWALRYWRSRRLALSGTPLDRAVLIYLALLLLRFVLDRSGRVGAWGLYISVLYLPLFWPVCTALQLRPRRLVGLMAVMVGVGGLVSLFGLAEFVINRPLWPSDEVMVRQGFADMFIYGTHVRRVYFTFDSPTTLANTLALLLPLALALGLLARRRWLRVLIILTVIVMSACIIVTFSRGIWVATILALAMMGIVARPLTTWPGWRRILPVVAGLAMTGLIFGGIALATRSLPSPPASAGVVELSPTAYRTAPVTGLSHDLIRTPPHYGQAVTQTWTIFDSIVGRDDTRIVLYEHPPESGKVEIIYRLTLPRQAALRFGIALSPQVWSPDKGDGASFQVYVSDPQTQAGQFVFVRYINPKHNPTDRRWRNFIVDLSAWQGRTVNLSLITEGGPAGDWAFDWAGWSDLQVVSMTPGYFASAQPNPLARYVASITDWTRDETNRDRLAAWGLALRTWQMSPLWGSGLGTTGAAALRTIPDRAFVTESQVLKALVELGLPGLLALAYLWFQTARVGYRAFVASRGPARILLWGLLTSLLVVFIEGWVYQNLEVKQVNAYFWTIMGMVASLAASRDAE